MCGIFGYVGLKNYSEDDLNASLQLIKHRGPDSDGIFKTNGICLLHTRLAIQDITVNASQPMLSDDGRFVIVFNGEIYNHLEIRKSLLSELTFKSSGDTETLLYGYIYYGIEILKHLNGIFAFAIYDNELKELFIARDPFGVKPLYYYRDDEIFLFGSEIKSFLPFKINKEISIETLANYIKFLWSPGSSTAFSHVKKLLPGYYFKFNIQAFSKTTSSQYFSWTPSIKNTTDSERDLVDRLENKLLLALDRQMLSDVPIGFFLSGGLDSSLLVAMARKLNPNRKIVCFTIDVQNWGKMGEQFENDIEYAKKVAEILDVELHVIKIDIDIVQLFDKVIWHLDEPQADPAPINLLSISKMASNMGIKVLIGGTGGDDIFSGYRRHQALYYEKFIPLLPLRIRKLIRYFSQQLPVSNTFFRRSKKLLADIDKTQMERQVGFFSWLPSNIVKSLFAKKWRLDLQEHDPYSYFSQLESQLPLSADFMDRMLYWELKTFLVDHNLNYTDKLSMAVGVEVRVPYLDVELVEFSKSIPTHLKMRGKETKYILKKVAEKYLPTDIIYRPKTGFGAPVRQWITNDLNQMIEERLSLDRLEKRGIFDPIKVWELIEANKKGEIDASYSIWSILAIESWLLQFADYHNIEVCELRN
jgi:asparagine synthase (glutamine-hydrolysing)